jgi:hypothetical protein
MLNLRYSTIPCILIGYHQGTEEAWCINFCPENGGDTLIQNLDKRLAAHTASQPKR